MKSRSLFILGACGLMAVFGLNLLAQEKVSSKKAPAVFQAKFETTAGDFVIEVHREWAPIGADRFYNLVESGMYDECKFFRVIPDFMVQFGISGDPKIAAKWRNAPLKDEPVMKSNKRGFVTYAKAGLNSRTSQIFINYKTNASLDSQGFAPFGQVVEGMDVVDKLNSEYGGAPSDDQFMIQEKGNEFLEKKYPRLDSIKRATIIDKK